MDQPQMTAQDEFGPTLLRGLVGLGPVDQRRTGLALELGLSLWMRRCGTNLVDAQLAARAAREVLIEVAGLDPGIEPIPLVGRSPKADIVNLAGYLSHLIQRAAAACTGDPGAVVERAIENLVLDGSTETAPERQAG
jgi:hypothetical protein